MIKVDIYTKSILTVIALALWALVLRPVYTPKTAEAANERAVRQIQSDLNSIAFGICVNSKIC